MGDAFKKVQTGDPLAIPAASFNAFIDAAQDFKQRALQGETAASREFRQTGIVLVRNDTGEARQRFDILGVQGPLIRPTDNAEVFKDRVTFKGVQPKRRHTGRFAVLLEPLPDGAIGRAVIDGAVAVRVEMIDECDRFAEVDPAAIDRLQSGVTGSAYLLWIQPKSERDTPEIAWTIARVGNPAEAPPCSSSSSGSSSIGSSMSSSSGSSGGSPGSSGGSEPSSPGSGSGSDPGGSGSDPGGSGSDPGGSGSDPGGGGSSGGGSNCFLFGTLVRLADGTLKPIEDIEPGDTLASLEIPGLARDTERRAQYEWLADDMPDITARLAAVSRVTHGEHAGFFIINERIKTTFEHPFLIRRDGCLGFCSTDGLRIGDRLLRHDMTEEPVHSIVRVERSVRTVALAVPGTNTYTADGVWVHNDGTGSVPGGISGGGGSGSSTSTPGSSGSGGSSGSSSGSGSSSDSDGKSSGSSFDSSGSSSGSGSSSDSSSSDGSSGASSDSSSSSSTVPIGIPSNATAPGSQALNDAVALGTQAGSAITGGLEGVPPPDWQSNTEAT